MRMQVVNETLRERATFNRFFAGSVSVGSGQYRGYKRPLALHLEGFSQIEMRDDIGALAIQCGQG